VVVGYELCCEVVGCGEKREMAKRLKIVRKI